MRNDDTHTPFSPKSGCDCKRMQTSVPDYIGSEGKGKTVCVLLTSDSSDCLLIYSFIVACLFCATHLGNTMANKTDMVPPLREPVF